MKFIFIVATLVALSTPAHANLSSLEAKVQALTDEIAAMKEEMALPPPASKTFGGLGPGASKVYFSKSPLSIGGYGEVVVQNIQGEQGDTADALRFVPYIGYRFTDKIILNAEIEIEHADEIFLEFGYLDFLLSDEFNVRLGLVLAPIGITNLMHEPTLFPSVNRSEVERNIIPTTWRENGALVYGEFGNLSYTLGAMNGFDGANFSDSSWIRGGRQKGSQAKSNNWGAVARLDYNAMPGFDFGVSAFSGKSSHGNANLGNATVTIWDAHMTFSHRNFKAKALFVDGSLDNSDLVSAVTTKTVGKKAQGYYVEAQYNIMPIIKPTTTKELNVFSRFEQYNTHKEVDASLTADPSLDRTRTVVGVNYLPHSNVILKTNWVFRSNESTTEEADLFELGIGYVF